MMRYCVVLFMLMIAQLKALTLQQIMENPQPGEYLTDEPVELLREKLPQQKLESKFETKKLLINLIRVNQQGKVSLDYYNSKLPGQKAVVMIEKFPPIEKDLILSSDTDLMELFGPDFQIHYHGAVTVWRFFNIANNSINLLHIDARYDARSDARLALRAPRRSFYYVSVMKFTANIASFKGFKKQDQALKNFECPPYRDKSN